MQLDPDEDSSDQTVLVYKNLLDIIFIFIHCPSTLPNDQNNSKCFKNSLERFAMMKTAETYGRIDKLL